MTENDMSKVKQGINKLLRLKTRKSSKKIKFVTQHENEENTNKFKLLSDADLHVKRLLSKYLVSIDKEDKTHLDVENKLKLINNKKKQKPAIKLFDLSEDDDKGDSTWGKSKTKVTHKRKHNLFPSSNNSSSNISSTGFKKFLTKKPEKNTVNNNSLVSFNFRRKTTKKKKKNISRQTSQKSEGTDNNTNTNDSIYYRAVTAKTVKSISSTALLRDDSSDDKNSNISSDDKTALENADTIKMTDTKKEDSNLKQTITKPSHSSSNISRFLFLKGVGSQEIKDYPKLGSNKQSKGELPYEPRSERLKKSSTILPASELDLDDNDIRKILPLDKQNYREFHGICSKLQDNIILKPNEKKDKNQIIRKKTTSKLLEKLSSLKNKKVYENEEETKPLIEKENTQSEEEKKSVNSKNNIIPKQSIESIGMITENKILQNSTLNDIDELEEEKRIEEIKYRVLSRKPQLVYDSISDEEDSDEEVVETTYIEPSSNIRLSYDCILFILEIYSMFYIPFSLAFGLNEDIKINAGFIFNVLIDCVFFFDIILSFFTAYYDFDEQLITEIELIAVHYLHTWFVLDFITGIPLNSLLDLYRYLCPGSLFTISTEQIFTSNSYTLINLLKLLRLLKAFKVFMSNSFVAKMHQFIKEYMLGKWLRLYVTLFIFVCFIHLFASIFIFCGLNYYPNWIVHKKMDPKDHEEVYVASIYFIFATVFSVGYGDVVNSNQIERCYNLFLLIVGLMIYSWTISSISSYYIDGDEKTNEYKRKTALLEEIRLTYDNMPQELFEKIQRYLLYRLNNDKIDCNSIFQALPIGLRNNLIYEMYKPIIQNFIFFKNFNSTDFIIKVILSFEPLYALKNERLVNDGDVMEEIIFVKNGKLVLEFPLPLVLGPELTGTLSKKLSLTLNPTHSFKDVASLSFLQRRGTKNYALDDFDWKKQNTKKVKPTETIAEVHQQYVKLIEIRRNEHFGDILMFLNKRSPLSVKVKSKIAELFLLKKTDAVEISMSFPKIWRQIIKKSLFNMQQINRLINKSLKFFFIHYEGKMSTLTTMNKDSIVKTQDGKTTFYKEIGTIKDIITNADDELKSIPESEAQNNVISEHPPSEEETECKNESNFRSSTKNVISTQYNNSALIEEEDDDDDDSLICSSNKSSKDIKEINSNLSNDTIKMNIENAKFNTKKFTSKKEKNKEKPLLILGDAENANNSSGFCLKYEPDEINMEYYPNETELKENVQYTRELLSGEVNNSKKESNIFNKLHLIEDDPSIKSHESRNSLLSKKKKKRLSSKKKFEEEKNLNSDINSLSRSPRGLHAFMNLESIQELSFNFGNAKNKKPSIIINLHKVQTIGSSLSKKSNKIEKIDDATIISNQNISPKIEKLELTKLRKSASITPNLSPKKKKLYGSIIDSNFTLNPLQNTGTNIFTPTLNPTNFFSNRKKSMLLPNETFLSKNLLSQNKTSQFLGGSQKKNVLEEISTNIQKNSLNLNNPEMFYSTMFAKVLGEEKEKDGNKNLNKKLNDLLKLIEDNEEPTSKSKRENVN